MTNFRDKTVGHSHTDPRLIQQNGCTSTLSIGQVVYLDADGIYKPARSSAIDESNIQGIVWSFVGNNQFYLKTSIGPLRYRFPYTKNFFNTTGLGKVDEYSPLNTKFPGNIGGKLYLSETIPGELQSEEPTYLPVIVGYKTSYGMIYRPDINTCCNNISPYIPDGGPILGENCTLSIYNLYDYDFDCDTEDWSHTTTRLAILYTEIPASIVGIPLIGSVDVTGMPLRYISCSGSNDTYCSSISGSQKLYDFSYTTNHSLCTRTIISPVIVRAFIDDVFNCQNGTVVNFYDNNITVPLSSQIPICLSCCITGEYLSNSSSSSSSA